jgi:hypothetical protein
LKEERKIEDEKRKCTSGSLGFTSFEAMEIGNIKGIGAKEIRRKAKKRDRRKRRMK